MDIEKQFPPYFEWLLVGQPGSGLPLDIGALWFWLLACSV
jgi:hypothetical protein